MLVADKLYDFYGGISFMNNSKKPNKLLWYLDVVVEFNAGDVCVCVCVDTKSSWRWLRKIIVPLSTIKNIILSSLLYGGEMI